MHILQNETDEKNKKQCKKETMKIDKVLEAIPEIANWLLIFISPALIGVILGVLIDFWLGGNLGLIMGIIVLVVGILIGILFAEWARKKEGTNNFMTRLSSTTPRKKDNNED